MKKFFISLVILPVALSAVYSQNNFSFKHSLEWEEELVKHSPIPGRILEFYTFPGANYDTEYPGLPYFTERFPLPSYGRFTVSLNQTVYEAIPGKPLDVLDRLGSEIKTHTYVEQERSSYFGRVDFIPIRQTANGTFEKLVSFDLEINFSSTPTPAVYRGNNTYNSVLNDANIFKMAVSEKGIHKITYEFLKNELGVSIDGVDIKNIKIYGNGGGLLPQLINTPRIDDLVENSIEVVDIDNNGLFGTSDFILLYAEGPGKWQFNPTERIFNFIQNPYDNYNYYFLKISPDQGKRVASQASLDVASYTSTGFNDFVRFEEEKVNLLSRKNNPNTQGSGKRWFGDFFDAIRTRDYNDIFNFPNIITTDSVKFKVEFAGRSNVSSRFKIVADGREFNSALIRKTNTGEVEDTYAHLQRITDAFFAKGDKIPVSISYPQVNSPSEGWLDYIQMNARRKLSFTGDQMSFRDIESLQYNSTTFQLGNASENIRIWEITDPLQPVLQEAKLNGTTLGFGVTSSTLREFVVFDPQSKLLEPIAIGQIQPQNAHGIDNVDLVIIYPEAYESQAMQLANHRRQYSQIEVAAVKIDQIYNEFSSGSVDPTAIRDFAKMLYDRNSRFRYLLLFGDGSFDYKNLLGTNEVDDKNHNTIAVYETDQSLHPISSFPSDDYYALLSPNEGDDQLKGALDIAVGRLPVRNETEAQLAVDKIINYETSPKALGDWRNRITFIADDEDSNTHINDTDRITSEIDENYKIFNIDKIYFDAFQQESTAGGEKYPLVTDAINANMFKGLLAINYLGHGGWKGWAQERVLNINHIRNWSNFNQLPLFVTATCSFSGYDEPTLTTGGEETILSKKGGAIALFSTVRAVFASSNFILTKAVFDVIFEKSGSEYATLGEVLRVSKNTSGASVQNSRKFTLLGDPSMKLAFPKYNVATSKINGRVQDGNQTDTLRALQRVTIEGEIVDDNGTLIPGFNGKVFPTIYDKVVTLSTLGQDQRSRVRSFTLQKSVIFKGVASVTNGKFQFSFVVPKDINFTYGFGKISYYANDETNSDAAGFYNNIIIGGADNSVVADNKGPDIEVFMNDTSFVFGGITNQNPVLLVRLADNNGINVVGNSIGHDLTGILDGDTQNAYQLNEFYESQLDDYTKGTVRFPIFDLKPGQHQIRVRAWDVANNASEGYTEFFVAESAELALDHVLNYPNPFTTNTEFQFEHNLAGQLLEVQVNIFTISGKLVKTLEEQIISNGFRITGISWDGTDDFGDRLAKGVYLYKVKVGASLNETVETKVESDFEKLVILK